jgi:hypothetical protein
MASPETLKQITTIYRDGEVINGCTDFAKVASQIQQQTGFSRPEEIVYEARRISRKCAIAVCIRSLNENQDN